MELSYDPVGTSIRTWKRSRSASNSKSAAVSYGLKLLLTVRPDIGVCTPRDVAAYFPLCKFP